MYKSGLLQANWQQSFSFVTKALHFHLCDNRVNVLCFVPKSAILKLCKLAEFSAIFVEGLANFLGL